MAKFQRFRSIRQLHTIIFQETIRPSSYMIKKNEQDEALDQLFPYGLSCIAHNTRPRLVEVQLNHFACGGAAVAVSMSHKVADALTMATFINNWAITTRCQSPIGPYFISSSTSNKIMPEFMIKAIDKVKYSSRRFVFPNAKLNELKNKVIAMCTTPTNPTRVELLASLLFN